MVRRRAGAAAAAALLCPLALVPVTAEEIAPDGVAWDYGIADAKLTVGAVCYLGDVDCFGDGSNNQQQAVYDCQLSIDSKVYVVDSACADSSAGVSCMNGVALQGNYSEYSSGLPTNAGASAVSYNVNGGPFSRDTFVYAFRCSCTEAWGQVEGPNQTCVLTGGAVMLSAICAACMLYAAVVLFDALRSLWRRRQEGVPVSRAGTVSAWMAALFASFVTVQQLLFALIAAGNLSLLSGPAYMSVFLSATSDFACGTAGIFCLLALAFSWIDLAKGALPLLTAGELRAFATERGVGLDQTVDRADLADWLAGTWGAPVELAQRVVANATALTHYRPEQAEEDGALLAGGLSLSGLLAAVQEVERAELERKFAARWGLTSDPLDPLSNGEQGSASLMSRQLRSALRDVGRESALTPAEINRVVGEWRSGGRGLSFDQFVAFVESSTTVARAGRMRVARVATIFATVSYVVLGLFFLADQKWWILPADASAKYTTALFWIWSLDLVGLCCFFHYAGKAVAAVLKPGRTLDNVSKAGGRVTCGLGLTIGLMCVTTSPCFTLPAVRGSHVRCVNTVAKYGRLLRRGVYYAINQMQQISSPLQKAVLTLATAAICHTLHVAVRFLGNCLEASGDLAGASPGPQNQDTSLGVLYELVC